MLESIKQDLLNKISNTDDENLLMLLQADFDYFTENNGVDAVDELSEKDKTELIDLVKEPFGQDTLSQSEFNEAIQQWRTK